jgi:hypothetical protein
MLQWSMSVELLMELKLAKETEYLEKPCHFVHYKSHMTWPGTEPKPLVGNWQVTAWAMAQPWDPVIYVPMYLWLKE